jgi:hypothetical protein
MKNGEKEGLQILGWGIGLGALFGGVAGAQLGFTVAGAMAAEKMEKGGSAKFIKRLLHKPMPPASKDDEVIDAIPVFDDEALPVRRLLLADGSPARVRK